MTKNLNRRVEKPNKREFSRNSTRRGWTQRSIFRILSAARKTGGISKWIHQPSARTLCANAAKKSDTGAGTAERHSLRTSPHRPRHRQRRIAGNSRRNRCAGFLLRRPDGTFHCRNAGGRLVRREAASSQITGHSPSLNCRDSVRPFRHG